MCNLNVSAAFRSLQDGVLHAAMDFGRLTRKHGVRIALSPSYSVEDCSLAVGKLVGHRSVKSAARMNNAVVIFLDSVEKADAVVVSGIAVHGALVPVLPLSTPAVRVTVSNVPPFIGDEALVKELSKHGKVVSPVKKVSSGCKSPLLRHVVSHKRQLLMVLNNRTKELNLMFGVEVEDFVYVVFATSDNMNCFRCGRKGHLARTCPGKDSAEGAGERGVEDRDSQGRQEKTGGVQQEGKEAQEETGGVKQAAENGQQGTGGVQQGGEASDGGQEGTSGGQQVGRMCGEGPREVQRESEVCERGEDGGCGGVQPACQGGDRVTEGLIEAQQVGQVSVGVNEETGGVRQLSQERREGVSGVQQVVLGGEEGQEKLEKSQETRAEEMRSESSAEDMEGEEEERKAPLKRRKTRSSGGASRAKKGSENRRSTRGKAGEPGSSADWDSTDSASSGGTVTSRYGVGRVKLFLKVTKNMKGVDMEEYFSDLEKFSRTARNGVSKKGSGRYTQQEVFRMRKIILKINRGSEGASVD
ncbi:uncharacterized protein LOC144384627 [Gasterosteus aculeatus]